MAAQLSARNTALMSFHSAPLEGSAIALRLMEGGFEPEIDWTNEDERATLIAIVRVRSLSLLNEYYQYNSGLLDEATFEYTLNRTLVIYKNCRFREVVIQRVPNGFLEFLKTNSVTTC